jgi:putative FmdB family regulatory protein
MPIYEFHCEKCETDNEILVRSSNWKGAKCPKCGSAKLTKKLSVFASQSAGQAASAPACGMSGGGGGGCGCACSGGRHRH